MALIHSTISTQIIQSQTPKLTPFQESVITNTECMETKQTKKRKAMAAANASNAPIDLAAKTPPAGVKLPHCRLKKNYSNNNFI